MFTGLIETVGKINSIQEKGDVWQIAISAPMIAAELKDGDSVAVSGTCLTVIDSDKKNFCVEMMEETKNRTKLGNLKSGASVNLERAMQFDSRFDGHMVSGHIDGIGKVNEIKDNGSTKKIFFETDTELLSNIVSKGSITIDGVSLTVIDVTKNEFSVGLIPTTLKETTLAELKVGSIVNLETDIIGKYVAKFLAERFSTESEKNRSSITWELLAKNGWV